MRWQTVEKRLSFEALERELIARVGVSGDDNDELIVRLLRELLDARAVVECATGLMKMPDDRVMRSCVHQSLLNYYGEKYIP